MAPLIHATAAVDEATRLHIYANAYRSRLVEALTEDYPGVAFLAGDELFHAICLGYIAARPSTFPNLRWYGGGLANYLAAAEPWNGQPIFAEMARFEWSLGLAFDAPDDPVVGVADVAAVAPEDWPALRFAPHRSLTVLALHCNAPALFLAMQEERQPDSAERADEPTEWVLWRHDGRNHFRSLAPSDAWALRQMVAGATFGDICAGLSNWYDDTEAPGHAASLLKGWVTEGWIRGLTVT